MSEQIAVSQDNLSSENTTPANEQPKYDFDQIFQAKIAALFVRNSQFAKKPKI